MKTLAVLTTLVAVAVSAMAAHAARDVTHCRPSHAAVALTRSGRCFVGTDSADTIVGTAASDVIYGWAGADRILGGAGNDRIFAGSENDVVYGGPGDDLIDAALGRDRVYGGAGRDLIKTRGGEPDWVSCGPGFDTAEVDKLDTVASDCEKVVVAPGY